MQQKSRFSKIIVSLSIAIGSLIILASLFLVILEFINSGRIVLGVRLEGEKISAMNFDSAKNLITDNYGALNQKKITLVYGEIKKQFLPQELGFSLNADRTFRQLSELGHKNNMFSSLKEQLKTLLSQQNISPQIDFNSEQFDAAINGGLSSIEIPAQNAHLVYNKKYNSFTISAEKNGLVIDRQKLQEQIHAVLKGAGNYEIEISLNQDQPQVSAKDIQSVRWQAQNLIEQGPYSLINDAFTWPIEKQDLASWISVNSSDGSLALSEDEIKNYLTQVSSAINQEPINARVTLQNGKIEILIPSQNGKKLDIEASGKKIAKNILAGQKNIELVVDLTDPDISEQNIKDLGITALLGRGESNFAGSPKNRIFNLTLGASRLNGWIIKPNEEFSFNQALGEVDEKNGYLPELVIKDNQTIPDFGGGICQVSTTVFRAAVNSGLKVTERHPHAYPVRYYFPTGFDATVFLPSPDLKFINDTPNYILIQNRIEGTKLIFEIYGTNDGRVTKVIGPKITESNPDGSLKTILTQEIWQEGQIVNQNIFRSSYKSASLYPHATTTPATTVPASPSAVPAPVSSATVNPLSGN